MIVALTMTVCFSVFVWLTVKKDRKNYTDYFKKQL